MGLEEVDLMLSVDAWSVGCGALHAKVVPDFAGVDCGLGLGNQFCPAHVLAIPVCGAVQGELGTLLATRIRWVLIRGT